MRHTHLEWLERVAKGDSNRQIADVAGVSDATLGRQVRAGELKPEMIIKIADAYEESPVIALVDLGFMSARWITEPGVTTALTRATDEQLTDELLRRLRLLDDTPVDELATRRSNAHLAVSSEFDITDAVADSSPEEDWEGAEFD